MPAGIIHDANSNRINQMAYFMGLPCTYCYSRGPSCCGRYRMELSLCAGSLQTSAGSMRLGTLHTTALTAIHRDQLALFVLERLVLPQGPAMMAAGTQVAAFGCALALERKDVCHTTVLNRSSRVQHNGESAQSQKLYFPENCRHHGLLLECDPDSCSQSGHKRVFSNVSHQNNVMNPHSVQKLPGSKGSMDCAAGKSGKTSGCGASAGAM